MLSARDNATSRGGQSGATSAAGSTPHFSLPLPLLHDLSSSYAARLYSDGDSTSSSANATSSELRHQAGMNLSTLRIIWPYLLSHAANASLTNRTLHVPCRPTDRPTSARRHAAASQRFLFMASTLLNYAAVWVHQPGGGVPPPDLRDNETLVEVTHCFYGNRQEHIDRYSPMWLFHAPGSGVAVRLGRALRVVGTKDTHELRYVLKRLAEPGSVPGSVRYLQRVASYLNASGLVRGEHTARQVDSVVFPNMTSALWGGERFTEIVLLRTGGREHSYLSSILPHLRCGRSPDGLRVGVRACRRDEPALTVHGPMCLTSRFHNGWLQSVYSELMLSHQEHGCARV